MKNEKQLDYWMFRDQRPKDNWTLIRSRSSQQGQCPCRCCLQFVQSVPGCQSWSIGLHVISAGRAMEAIPNFVDDCGTSLLVTDFAPLRQIGKGRKVHEVDAHNCCNPRMRSGIWRSDLLTGIISLKSFYVPEIEWCEPGEKSAMEVIKGSKNGFLTSRMTNYATNRNNPLKPKSLSGLSPYLHFGQISVQRCALEAQCQEKLSSAYLMLQLNSKYKEVHGLFEELIIRRELAHNFCFYQPHYDSMHGARREQLEKGKTADPLEIDASPLEGAWFYADVLGKILEWTNGPKEAIAISIHLNGNVIPYPVAAVLNLFAKVSTNFCLLQYEIDGSDPNGDPNGYVGCMWSMCGVHDQIMSCSMALGHQLQYKANKQGQHDAHIENAKLTIIQGKFIRCQQLQFLQFTQRQNYLANSNKQ
ncbi:hypothetical protein RJ641_035411 [Dillenia turbinata]|uniref:Uncharacterized protein n=1 Tax=Dillenia turbinata TaxID=194707 RepID=A0AAN8VSI1_9MAGN